MVRATQKAMLHMALKITFQVHDPTRELRNIFNGTAKTICFLLAKPAIIMSPYLFEIKEGIQ